LPASLAWLTAFQKPLLSGDDYFVLPDRSIERIQVAVNDFSHKLPETIRLRAWKGI
jgi:hypothetical protein